MKTIATFSKPEEAHLLRMRLEDVGLRAFVCDEHMVQLDWFYSNAIGGVRVQVFPEDESAAEEFLAADPGVPGGNVVEKVPCPFCGSTSTALDDSVRNVAYLAVWFFPLLVVLGPPLYLMLRRRSPGYNCNDCRRAWRVNLPPLTPR